VSDEYLWDRSGEADPDIARLEQVLGRLRAKEPPPPLVVPARLPARSPMTWFVLPFAAAATLIVAAASAWLSFFPPGPAPAWQVSRLDGSPRVASKPLTGATGELPVGEWLETDARARARIRVAHIGRVDVEPATRVGLLSAHAGDYRLRLDRGTLVAFITAPARQFRVETPSAVAVDLGCAYSLHVRDDGESELRVTAGWVSLQGPQRASFVRAGAQCLARRGSGPGTPHLNDVSVAFRDAVRLLDFERASPQARSAAVDRVLAETRPRDAITLWHLLSRVDSVDRDRLFDRLAAIAPPPPGVTRDGIRAGTTAMLDRWWDAAKLGPPRRWR
jgi:FecR protein